MNYKYKENHLDEKYAGAKEQLLSLLEELPLDEYWYKRNRNAIEQL